MSLINDALRRARQSQKTPPPLDSAPAGPGLPPSQPPAPLEPVEPPPISPWPSLLGVALVAVLVLGLIGTGGWFLMRAWSSKRSQRVACDAPAVVVTQPQPAAAGAANAHTSTNARPVAPTATATASAAPVSNAVSQPPPAPLTSAVVAAVAPPPVKWPHLRLQGIFYKPSAPFVVINNRTLYRDEMIEGAKVVAISSHNVTLVLGGQTNVMVLR